MKTRYMGLAFVVAAGLQLPLAYAQTDNVYSMPAASQMEVVGKISRVNEATSTVWIDGRAYRFSQTTAVFINGARVLGLSKIKPGDEVAYEADEGRWLSFLVVSNNN